VWALYSMTGYVWAVYSMTGYVWAVHSMTGYVWAAYSMTGNVWAAYSMTGHVWAVYSMTAGSSRMCANGLCRHEHLLANWLQYMHDTYVGLNAPFPPLTWNAQEGHVQPDKQCN
jgi:hypothetical protein